METKLDKATTKYLKSIKIYDNQGETFDQYTAIFTKLPEYGENMFSAVGMSECPFSPQGFGQHCTAKPGKHLGKRINFEQLPIDCQKLILQDVADLIESDKRGDDERPMGL